MSGKQTSRSSSSPPPSQCFDNLGMELEENAFTSGSSHQATTDNTKSKPSLSFQLRICKVVSC